ncbi:MAG: hypothetical protein QGG40_01880 [Myxococcota bacterium]|nr:hypothetical protein [Myxococcota bacterium]
MSGGPQYLNREEDVLSHLLWASVEVRQAKVQVQGRTVRGALRMPDPSARVVPFVLDESYIDFDNTPKEGAVVQVEYSSAADTYSFLTNIAMVVDPSKWRLDFPKVIERTDRRMMRRHRVADRPGFGFHLKDAKGVLHLLMVNDINSVGVGVIFDPRRVKLENEQFITATLTLPGCEPREISAEVRNVRRKPGDSDLRIAGCRLSGIAPEIGAALAEDLARLDLD